MSDCKHMTLYYADGDCTEPYPSCLLCQVASLESKLSSCENALRGSHDEIADLRRRMLEDDKLHAEKLKGCEGRLSSALLEQDHQRKCAVEWHDKFLAASHRLDSCEERFQAARDAYDVLFVESIGDKDAAHRTLVEALAGVKFVKPTAEDLEACRRDLIQAGIVERQESK